MPRSSQMHQILSQTPVYNVSMTRNLGKPFASAGVFNFKNLIFCNSLDPLKPFASGIEFNQATSVSTTVMSRSATASSVAPLSQRVQTSTTVSLSGESFLQSVSCDCHLSVAMSHL